MYFVHFKLKNWSLMEDKSGSPFTWNNPRHLMSKCCLDSTLSNLLRPYPSSLERLLRVCRTSQNTVSSRRKKRSPPAGFSIHLKYVGAQTTLLLICGNVMYALLPRVQCSGWTVVNVSDVPQDLTALFTKVSKVTHIKQPFPPFDLGFHLTGNKLK